VFKFFNTTQITTHLLTLKLSSIVLASVLCANVFADTQEIDPTKPFHLTAELSSSKATDRLSLQSVIRVEQQLKAVINGKVLRVGEQIAGYQIMAIKHHAVELKSEQNTLILSLFSQTVTK
jgi:MSHA biogenesis protein MshK